MTLQRSLSVSVLPQQKNSSVVRSRAATLSALRKTSLDDTPTLGGHTVSLGDGKKPYVKNFAEKFFDEDHFSDFSDSETSSSDDGSLDNPLSNLALKGFDRKSGTFGDDAAPLIPPPPAYAPPPLPPGVGGAVAAPPVLSPPPGDLPPALPPGVVKFEGTRTPSEANRIINEWNTAYTGLQLLRSGELQNPMHMTTNPSHAVLRNMLENSKRSEHRHLPFYAHSVLEHAYQSAHANVQDKEDHSSLQQETVKILGQHLANFDPEDAKLILDQLKENCKIYEEARECVFGKLIKIGCPKWKKIDYFQIVQMMHTGGYTNAVQKGVEKQAHLRTLADGIRTAVTTEARPPASFAQRTTELGALKTKLEAEINTILTNALNPGMQQADVDALRMAVLKAIGDELSNLGLVTADLKHGDLKLLREELEKKANEVLTLQNLAQVDATHINRLQGELLDTPFQDVERDQQVPPDFVGATQELLSQSGYSFEQVREVISGHIKTLANTTEGRDLQRKIKTFESNNQGSSVTALSDAEISKGKDGQGGVEALSTALLHRVRHDFAPAGLTPDSFSLRDFMQILKTVQEAVPRSGDVKTEKARLAFFESFFGEKPEPASDLSLEELIVLNLHDRLATDPPFTEESFKVSRIFSAIGTIPLYPPLNTQSVDGDDDSSSSISSSDDDNAQSRSDDRDDSWTHTSQGAHLIEVS